jgi:hypothetical protein
MQQQTYRETANFSWMKGNVKSQQLVPATQVYVNSLMGKTNKEITHIFKNNT